MKTRGIAGRTEALALFGLLLGARPVAACVCEPPVHPCGWLAATSVVFVGRVLEIGDASESPKGSGEGPPATSEAPVPDAPASTIPPVEPETAVPDAPGSVVAKVVPEGPWVETVTVSVESAASTTRLRVEEALRGVEAGTTVEVWTPGSCSMCGFPFRKGKRYLVVAGRDEKGRLHTDRCMGTNSLRSATEGLRYFRHVRQRGPTGVLAGILRTLDRDNPFQSPEYHPLAGKRVRVSGSGVVRWATTDHEGRFYWEDLQPGEYSVQALPCPGYFDPGSRNVTVKLDRCGQVQIEPRKLASVHGRLVDTGGQGVVSRSVRLVPVDHRDPQGTRRSIAASSWEDGTFWFFNLPKGRYLLFPPGLTRREDARMITAAPATDVDLGDFVVPRLAGNDADR